MQTIVLVEIDI